MVKHDVILRGASFLRAGPAPALLRRTDEDFVAALLEELAAETGRDVLADKLAHWRGLKESYENGYLKLFQPVHRTFHLALVESVCATFGEPRLDPARIASAGLVVRRVAAAGAGSKGKAERLEGWMQQGRRLRGWVPFHTPQELDADPQADHRRPAVLTGHLELDRQPAFMNGQLTPFTESVAPLFVAPPEVCQAAKRTLLFGLVPVTSSETSEAPNVELYPEAFVRGHLPSYLKAADHTRVVPQANAVLNRDASETPDNAPEDSLKGYIDMLRQLAYEFDSFSEQRLSKEVFAALNQIALPYADGKTQPAGEHFKQAVEVLVKRIEGQQVTMPREWPAVSQTQADKIVQAVKAALDARLASLAPGRGRFDDPTALYQARAFIRVIRPDGCPPDLVWSDVSERFRIAPWYDTGPLPPVEITLPNLANLTKVKPNVAFRVPKDLFNLLQNNKAEDMATGKGKKNTQGLQLDWICGFSLPIITFCAFIVLNLFLQLFDIIFQWLLWVKICIPIPKSSSSQGS